MAKKRRMGGKEATALKKATELCELYYGPRTDMAIGCKAGVKMLWSELWSPGHLGHKRRR